MRAEREHDLSAAVRALAERQHWVVTRGQLLRLGLTDRAITWWEASGRLHRLHRGVYAVGRPQVTRHGAFLAAVFACGPRAALSHDSAAAAWGIRRDRPALPIEVCSPSQRRRPGIVVHRCGLAEGETTRRHGIPVVTPAVALVGLAARLDPPELERAIGEADRLGLIDPERLRRKVEGMAGRAGVRTLRETLDRHTFRLTRSELERLFIPTARRAGLPVPATQAVVNGFEVDFFWPALGLVVETDGLRYHRTAAQQTRDRRRDQVHTAAGLTPLRFTHWQVRFEGAHVEGTLRLTAQRLHSMRPS